MGSCILLSGSVVVHQNLRKEVRKQFKILKGNHGEIFVNQ